MRQTKSSKNRFAPINPSTPSKITVAGTINETKAKDSRKASAKTMGAVQPLWLRTNVIVDWAKSFMIFPRGRSALAQV
jgi:hypothetical protein